MKRKLGIIICIFVFFAVYINTFAYASSDPSIDTQYTTKGSKIYRYPYYGLESKVQPEYLYYYIDFYDGNGNFVKTQQVRQADDYVTSEVYPDLSEKFFEYKPLSNEDFEKYCEQYGYTGEKLEEVQDSTDEEVDYSTMDEANILIKQLRDDEKLDLYYNNIKAITFWKHDSRLIELMTLFSGDKITERNITKSNYDSSLAAQKLLMKDLIINSVDAKISVLAVPYKCEEYKYGLTNYYKGEPVIIVFVNDSVSLSFQLKVQLAKLRILEGLKSYGK